MTRNYWDRHRGVLAVLAAFFLVGLLGMVAFAVDLGYIAHCRSEMQRAADACSLAAAARLPNQVDAIAAAVAASQENSSNVSPLLSADDVEFGYWNRDTASFSDPPPANRSVNAVRVTLLRTEANGNALTLFFARVLGRNAADVTSIATASMDRSMCGPFIGIESLTAMGNVNTNSFDSRTAAYNPATSGHRGSLCSDGPMTLNGGVYIQGDARAGRGYDVTIHGASAVVTGNIGSRVKPLDFPSADASAAALDNDNADLPPLSGGKKGGSPLDNQRDFQLNGTTTYTMPPGTYYFDDMDLTGQSVLNIIGETIIYLTGDLKRAGGTQVNNNTGLAGLLRIYSTGGDIDITSDNNFYGVIYAPDSDVDIGGTADYFGAIVGRTLRVHGDATGHYDESLDLEEVDLPRRTTLVE